MFFPTVVTGCCLHAGVEEHCTDYQYVEQRQGWDVEQRRLKKELEKHDKQAAKVAPAWQSHAQFLHSSAFLLWLAQYTILYTEQGMLKCISSVSAISCLVRRAYKDVEQQGAKLQVQRSRQPNQKRSLKHLPDSIALPQSRHLALSDCS